MPVSYIFWGLMIIWVIFGPGYGIYADVPNRRLWGFSLLPFILLAMLGWTVFGGPVK